MLTAIAIVVLQFLYRLASDAGPALSERRKNTILLLSFLTVGAHIHREWHLGQVNLVLLALYVTMLCLWGSKQFVTAGIHPQLNFSAGCLQARVHYQHAISHQRIRGRNAIIDAAVRRT